MRRKLRHRHMRLGPRRVEVEAGVELEEVQIPRLVLRQKHDRSGRLQPLAQLDRIVVDRHLAADDGLDARPGRRDRKFERCEHVVRVGDGHRRHPGRLAEARQFLQPHGAFQKRMLGMDAKVDESGDAAHE
jgi:hypothetical protein